MTANDIRKLLLPVAVLALVLGAAGCANPAENAPDAEVADATPVERSGEGEQTVYTIGPESAVEWVGSKVTGSHDGGFERFEGEITLVDGDPTKSSVDLRIDATSIWSDNEQLTGHLKTDDFFEVETYPTATFESTRIEDAGDGTYRVTGNLEMKGVTKSVTFPATIDVTDDMITANAEFSIKRFDWNIEYKGRKDDLIRDEVLIRFDLVAMPAS